MANGKIIDMETMLVETNAANEELAAKLMQHHEAFLVFAQKRLADPHLAVDAVQESLFKALRSAGQIQDRERVVAWFYRILRRTILDLYRHRTVQRRVLEPMPEDFEAVADVEDKADICECLRTLLGTLKPEYAFLIEEVDLNERSIEEVARALAIEPNNARVRLHRARRQMHERLLQSCQLCAEHGCFDCSCQRTGEKVGRTF
ncbi:MAG: sigma-70 family RNA polymerase sigma factor [Verrucomicrobiota bacterium]